MSHTIANDYPLFESIKCENGIYNNLSYHERRMKESSKKYWGRAVESVNWFSLFQGLPLKGILKFKVHYNENQFLTEVINYEKRTISELILVEANQLIYDLKYTDRNALNELTQNLLPHQDIIIEKNGFILDSSYANLALWDGENWATPKSPLLKGTKRAYYLHEQMLIERDIKLKDLGNYSKISLINSMLDLGETVVGIEHVSMA